MKLISPAGIPALTASAATDHRTDGTYPPRPRTELLCEHSLEVFLSGTLVRRMVCSPLLLPELVLGHLNTSGIISCAGDVEELIFSPDGARADVTLSRPVAPPPACTVDTVNSSAAMLRAESGRRLTPIPYRNEWILRLASSIDLDTPLYSATHSAHSAILMLEGEILLCCEDIGRHNALDKAVGWAMLREIPLSRCILYTSGRVPVDMVSKAISAGIPVLVSKALPTVQALALARRHRLTLIGAAHPHDFKVFDTTPEVTAP